MKKLGWAVVVVLIGWSLLMATACGRQKQPAGSTVVDYGFEPPGLEPEIFAPGIVSTTHQEHSTPAVSPDGQEIYWSLWMLPRNPEQPPQMIRFIRRTGNGWSEPETAPFSGTYNDGGPCFTPDGQRLIFYSNRPLTPEGDKQVFDLWFVERQGDGWSTPNHLGVNVADGWFEASTSVAANSDLYLMAGDPGDRSGGRTDIYLSRYQNGRYLAPQRLDDVVNTDTARESFPCIATDQSYLIFCSDSRRFAANGALATGARKMMISFRGSDGRWQQPQSMGSLFNRKGARFPGLSPDGRILFFTRYVDAPNEDIFWVDTGVIDQVRKQPS
jgi:Tol biopolymer transport system component